VIDKGKGPSFGLISRGRGRGRTGCGGGLRDQQPAAGNRVTVAIVGLGWAGAMMSLATMRFFLFSLLLPFGSSPNLVNKSDLGGVDAAFFSSVTKNSSWVLIFPFVSGDVLQTTPHRQDFPWLGVYQERKESDCVGAKESRDGRFFFPALAARLPMLALSDRPSAEGSEAWRYGARADVRPTVWYYAHYQSAKDAVMDGHVACRPSVGGSRLGHELQLAKG